MRLAELVSFLPAARILGDPQTIITGITADSRLIQPGWLYIAVVGLQSDGHSYIGKAQDRGAAALLTEHEVDSPLPQLITKRTQSLIGTVASAFYGFPGEKLRVIGITGTKGKTSTSYLLDHLLCCSGKKTSILGSIGGRVAQNRLPATLTTRPAAELQELLHQAVDAGEEYMILEVGSHSLVQRRVTGVPFDSVIFTNLSHDHLDYHGTMESYFQAKASLFAWLGCSGWGSDPVKGKKTAILNRDDLYYQALVEHIAVPILSYGLTDQADLWASDIASYRKGTVFTVNWSGDSTRAYLPLVGRFSVVNTLGALAGGLIEGLSLNQMITDLSSFQGTPGRFERVDFGQPFQIIVDYAHTEDSLRQVLTVAREMTQCRIILVFGCTGDRDRIKRPLMGALAVSLADRVILTSDDPHGEDPQEIIDEIARGIPLGMKNWSMQPDRGAAIEEALNLAKEGDLVLLAGKGHETVQVFKDYSIPFSDQATAAAILMKKGYRRIEA
ncbi:MAG: UDP-N-acetylmuramoyl-L-alanyl-D-glutamate--2,6-diaminopimelate ligase [Symbiobacteriaceae bacterium]|nr:UDP-N-acetylmuramoyl-L-alanyl-D-glutamate--2,6-diaminopimelate ligase [Symbiobacteriaceae bacterium]